MFGFIKSKSATPKNKNLFARLKDGLKRTRSNFTGNLLNLLLNRQSIDKDLLEEIETILLMADVGVDATSDIIENLTKHLKNNKISEPKELIDKLKEHLHSILQPCSQTLDIPKTGSAYTILVTGINGAGKTTTIGKMAHQFQQKGYSVMLAAGDTYRAAAVEQLETWGERHNTPVISQSTGADSASVIFDAIKSAQAKKVDILIADTAGRLHTKSNLMEELKKVKRVMAKADQNAPHETMLVLDASIGQNALNQAQTFHQDMNVTGITITKLDGTAKGGILFAIARQLNIPIRYIGIGEGSEDLREFNADNFINALFENDSQGEAK